MTSRRRSSWLGQRPGRHRQSGNIKRWLCRVNAEPRGSTRTERLPQRCGREDLIEALCEWSPCAGGCGEFRHADSIYTRCFCLSLQLLYKTNHPRPAIGLHSYRLPTSRLRSLLRGAKAAVMGAMGGRVVVDVCRPHRRRRGRCSKGWANSSCAAACPGSA